MPSGTLSSWAIRSNRGSVTSKRSRNRLRTSPAISVVQVSSRSHSRSSSPWSSGVSPALVSESRIVIVPPSLRRQRLCRGAQLGARLRLALDFQLVEILAVAHAVAENLLLARQILRRAGDIGS